MFLKKGIAKNGSEYALDFVFAEHTFRAKIAEEKPSLQNFNVNEKPNRKFKE